MAVTAQEDPRTSSLMAYKKIDLNPSAALVLGFEYHSYDDPRSHSNLRSDPHMMFKVGLTKQAVIQDFINRIGSSILRKRGGDANVSSATVAISREGD
jgi:hypothetical protein